jgi:hypothetical protein
MGKIVKNYESFRGIEPVKEEFIFKALANLFKGLFKKIKDKIEKLGDDFNAKKTLIKTEIINPKSTGSIFTPLFNEYNAKPQWNDQDCFDFISKMIDPDDGVMSQSGIETFIADFKDETEKKMWRYIFESIRNKTIVALQYGGGPTFKVGVKLPVPAIKPELKSGKKHLPVLKALIAKLTDDKKKEEVKKWVNNTVIPQMFELSDALTEQEVDNFSGKGEGKGTIVLKWKNVEIELKVPVEGSTKYEVTRSSSQKLVVAEGKKVFTDISGEAKKGATIKLTGLTSGTADGQVFEIDGKSEYETGVLDQIKVDGKEVESHKFGEANAGKEEPTLSYEKLKPIFDNGQEVIFLLPDVDATAYDAKKKPEEQKDVVGVGKMKLIDDKNNDESITFEHDGKEFKAGYNRIVGFPNVAEEAEEAKNNLAEIKDDPEKMKKVASYADFLKKGSDEDVKTINDMIEDELSKLK